jgi:hypothetical protein
VPSSRNIPTEPELLTRSRINYVSSGSGSVLRTDTSSSLATDPTPLTSSRTCHRHVTDIAIATTGTRQDHIDAVRDVLQVAEQHDLYFKLSKCTFHASSIDYLGVIIEKGMTRMDPVKIAGIKNWPIPVKVKDVRSFLGFCNFYRPFI